MFKFATTRLFVKSNKNWTVLKQLKKLNYFIEQKPMVFFKKKLLKSNLKPFRWARRNEDLSKKIRKTAAWFVRKLRKKKPIFNSFWIKPIYKKQTINKTTTIFKPITTWKWDKVPFSFKTTKSLTFFKGRKTFKNDIYMTFNNFTNLLFTIQKIIYFSKLKPKKYLMSYFFFKKKKLNIIKTVDTLVFQTLKKQKLEKGTK